VTTVPLVPPIQILACAPNILRWCLLFPWYWPFKSKHAHPHQIFTLVYCSLGTDHSNSSMLTLWIAWWLHHLWYCQLLQIIMKCVVKNTVTSGSIIDFASDLIPITSIRWQWNDSLGWYEWYLSLSNADTNHLPLHLWFQEERNKLLSSTVSLGSLLTQYARPGGFIIPTSFPFGWIEYESYLPLAHDTGVNIGESMLQESNRLETSEAYVWFQNGERQQSNIYLSTILIG
jgi:hypothetical protein